MPTRLAQHLIQGGLIERGLVERAVQLRADAGGTLDTALLEVGAISEAGMLQSLADVSEVRLVNLADFEPNPGVAEWLPAKIAERLVLAPLSMDQNVLHLACTYPIPLAHLQEVEFLLGTRLEPWVALECRVRDWLRQLYRVPLSPRYESLLRALDPGRVAADAPPIELTPAVETSVTRQMVERLAQSVVEEPLGPSSESWSIPAASHELVPPPALSGGEIPMPGGPRVDATERPPLPGEEPPLEEARSRWSLDEGRAALKGGAHDRAQLFEVILRFARQTFHFTAAFAVRKGAATRWAEQGEGGAVHRGNELSIPLDAASVFRTVAMTRGSYVGAVPKDGLTAQYLQDLGRTPRTMFLFPIEVKGRLVAMLYGDNGNKPISQRSFAELMLFCQELPAALQELIVARKPKQAPPRAKTEPFGLAALGALLGADDGETPAAPTPGWSPLSVERPQKPGRLVSLPPLAASEDFRPPPDFARLFRVLLGPDVSARARAMVELARAPEAAAQQLAAQFPGPTAWSRIPLGELPDPDELGPIPGALTRLGRAGAAALAPLLQTESSDTRYFALLTAGNLPYPELVEGVVQALFDLEPDISSAARVAAQALRRLPRFEVSLKELRLALDSPDPLRRSLAARALGALRDRESIELLIALTSSEDAMSAQSAAEALREITKASYGPQPRLWIKWWEQNRNKPRVDWLLAGLRHPDLEVRMKAIDELSQALQDDLGYFADAPRADRDAAIARWASAAAQGKLNV